MRTIIICTVLFFLGAFSMVHGDSDCFVEIAAKACIRRDKTSKEAMLHIDTVGGWKLFAGTSPVHIDLRSPVIHGDRGGIYPISVPTTTRRYFQLETSNGIFPLVERRLPMAGGHNFRDLGGIKTKDGRYVQWGKLIRADELHELTHADLEYLTSLPLVTIVDFRSKEEVKKHVDKVPPSVKKTVACSIDPGNLTSIRTESLSELSVDQAKQMMREINGKLITDASCIGHFKKFFHLLQEERNIPLLFHCTAGKDRTGMAAALVLSALGVDEETIVEEYMLSNKFLEEKYARYRQSESAMKYLIEVHPEYLRGGLNQIKKDHGSIDAFLKGVLSVDLERMKRIYLD